MHSLKFNLYIIKFLIKEKINQNGRLFLDASMLSVRCGVLLILYAYVFEYKGGTINGVSYQIAAWSMFVYFMLMTVRLRAIANNIMSDIISGRIDTIYTKPINYILYRMCYQVGDGLYSLIIMLIIGISLMIYFIGVPLSIQTPFFYFTFVLALLGSMLTSLLLFTLVGMSSFWVQDNSPLQWIIDKSVMLLGGSYLPIALFPPILYKLAIYTPLGTANLISHTVYDNWRFVAFKLLTIQYFWIIVLALILYFVYKLSLRKLTINGG